MGAALAAQSEQATVETTTDESSSDGRSKPSPMQQKLRNNIKVKNIHIDVDPPSRGFTRIKFASQTRDELITHQLMNIFKANTFDNVIREVNASKGRLQRLGVFNQVNVEIGVTERTDADNPKNAESADLDVNFNVSEKGPLLLGTNVNTETGVSGALFGISGTLNNIRGLGEAFKFNYRRMYDTLNTTYELAYTKPLFLNPDTIFAARVLKTNFDFLQSGYRESAHKAQMDLSFLSLFGLHTVGWEGVLRENIPNKLVPFEVREFAGHSLKSSLVHSLVYDSRDNGILPSCGIYFRNNVELAGLLGNTKFVKSDINIQYNKTLFWDNVLTGTIQAGAIKPLENSDPMMINDKYFLGGNYSVRGYEMHGIGHHSEAAAMGGEVFVSGGLHLCSPLPFRPGKGGFGDNFRVHFFANAGNLSHMDAVKNPKEFIKNARTSVGFGLMYNLFGQLRLELNYCVPLRAQPGDRSKPGLQMSIGLDFI